MIAAGLPTGAGIPTEAGLPTGAGIPWTYDGSPESLFDLTARAWKECRAPESLACSPRQRFDPEFFGWRTRKKSAYLPRRLEAAALRIWMSGQPLIAQLLRVAAIAGASGQDALSDWTNPDLAEVARAIRSVCREEHLLKGFARFEESGSGLLVAPLEPDYDVLPALVPWFEARFGPQAFALADMRRGYAIVSDPGSEPRRRIVTDEIVSLGSEEGQEGRDNLDRLGCRESGANLWRRYFSATENASRKNPALQRRLLPLRYRARMTEFGLDAGDDQERMAAADLFGLDPSAADSSGGGQESMQTPPR